MWLVSLCVILAANAVEAQTNRTTNRANQTTRANQPDTKSREAASPRIVTVARSTPEATRKGEGDVIELDDGRLLLVYMEFSGTGSDFAKTRFVAQESAEIGRAHV